MMEVNEIALPAVLGAIGGPTYTPLLIAIGRIEVYADDMQRRCKFPAPVVFEDSDGALWLADGFHRYYAAKQLNLETERGDGCSRPSAPMMVGILVLAHGTTGNLFGLCRSMDMAQYSSKS